MVPHMLVKVAQLCPTLCEPMDYTVHGILQARILEWVAFPFSKGSSQPRDWTQVSHIGGGFFTSWATREAQEYWSGSSRPRNRTGVSLPTELSIRGAYICKMVAYKPCFEAPGQYCRSLCLGTWFEVHQIVLNINFGEGTLCKIQSGSTLSADPSSLMWLGLEGRTQPNLFIPS